MKLRVNWQLSLGFFLVIMSIAFYAIHYFIFRDAHHVFIFLLGDIAFVPIEVLLVTLILHRLLSAREKKVLLNKLNMVIGTFYSEVGTHLSHHFIHFDPNAPEYSQHLVFTKDSAYGDLLRSKKRLAEYAFKVQLDEDGLEALKVFLLSRRDFLLRLLENPNLLEHESFTELLLAIFHLTEELSLKRYPIVVLTGQKSFGRDIARAYRALVFEWVDYLAHLRTEFPYLYSLALRTNPFNTLATVEF